MKYAGWSTQIHARSDAPPAPVPAPAPGDYVVLHAVDRLTVNGRRTDDSDDAYIGTGIPMRADVVVKDVTPEGLVLALAGQDVTLVQGKKSPTPGASVWPADLFVLFRARP